MSELDKTKTGGKRPPKSGELRTYDTARLLALYRKACERLRDNGGWRGEPLAAAWAAALADELARRDLHSECLRIEHEVDGAVPEAPTATGQRRRWEV